MKDRQLTFGIEVPVLSRKEWRIHALCWLVGFAIINWPGNRITVGVFINEEWGLLIPSLYGTLINVILFYRVILLIQKEKAHYSFQLFFRTLFILLLASLAESILDLITLWTRSYTLNSFYIQEVLFGNILMNFFLFYIAAWVYGVIKVSTTINHYPTHKISIHDGHSKVLVEAESINYLESDGNYVKYHLKDRVVLERSTLSNTIEKLPSQFIRCHKSFIVNSAEIERIAASDITIGKASIPVGRKYKANLMHLMNEQ